MERSVMEWNVLEGNRKEVTGMQSMHVVCVCVSANPVATSIPARYELCGVFPRASGLLDVIGVGVLSI